MDKGYGRGQIGKEFVHPAGQGEEKTKPSADQRPVSHTRSLMAWKGFREWWDVHVLFPRAVGEVWGVGMERPSE